MRLTEEQAKTKQCHVQPAALIPQAHAGQLARAGQMEQVLYGWGNCVGSKCCHWRWLRERVNDEITMVMASGSEDLVGYCGLAGRPD